MEGVELGFVKGRRGDLACTHGQCFIMMSMG